MVANFGNTIIEGGIEPEVKVQEPVSDQSGAVLARGMQSVFADVGGIIGGVFKGNQEKEQSGILFNLQNQWLDVADAVEQGQLTQPQARTLIRNSFRTATANDPGLYEDINKLHATFMTSSGLGNIIVEGTVEEKAYNELKKSAITAGWPDVQTFQQHLAAQNQLNALKSTLEGKKAQGELATIAETNQAKQIAGTLVQTGYPWVKQRLANAMSEMESNPDNKAQILADINFEIGNKISEYDYLTSTLDNAYIIEPIKGLLDSFNKYANGTVSTELMEAELKSNQTKLELMLQADPVLGPKIAASKVLKEVGMENAGLMLWPGEAVSRLINLTAPDEGAKPVDMIDDKPETAAVLQFTRESIAKYNTDSSDPEKGKELTSAVTQVIDGIYTNSLGVNNPTEFRESIEFLGHPEVQKFVQAQGGLPSKFKDQVLDTVRQQYNTALLPAIATEWNKERDTIYMHEASAYGMGQQPDGFVGGASMTKASGKMSEMIMPVWNGSGVEFKPAAGFEDDANALAMAREANTGSTSIAMPLNNLINFMSTVGGEKPQTYYEEIASRVFGNEHTTVTDDGKQKKVKTKEQSYDIASFNSEDVDLAFQDIPESVASAATVEGGFLDFIGSKEAPKGYDQQYGGAKVQPSKPLTDMTVKEVRAHQREMLAGGSASTAVGKYQVIGDTLQMLIDNGVISPRDKFDEATQDKIAIGLMRIRGLDKWMAGEMTDEQFANELAKEWASLPVVSGKGKGKSFYAGDGLNRSFGSPEDVIAALQTMKGA